MAVKVVVVNAIGDKLYIEVDPKNTNVNEFEEQIAKRMGLDVNEFRKRTNLFFEGKLLTKKEAKLSEIGIYNGGNLSLLNKRKFQEKSKDIVLEPMMIEEIEKRTKIFGNKVAPSPAEKLPINSVGDKLINLFQALLSSQLSEEEEQPENEAQVNGQAEQAQQEGDQQGQQQEEQELHEQEQERQQQEQHEQQEEELKLPEVNQEALDQLKDMGFPEERARKALLLTGDAESALNWLFQHEDDPHADDPLTEEEIRRISQKNSIQVNEQTLQQLLEMGFAKEDCIMALQLTNNNYERACAWLIGDREIPPVNPPVDPSNIVQLLLSPMIQAMQSNPQIAQSLQDPRTLVALQEVIDNPRRISNYVNDPVIAPVLLEAVRFLRRLS